MTKPNSPSNKKDENTARFRAILSAGEEAEPAPLPKPKSSLMDRLPRAGKKPPVAVRPSAPPAQNQSPAVVPISYSAPADAAPRFSGRRFGPAFWTITGLFSLVVNIILIVLVIVLYGQIARMQISLSRVSELMALPVDTVSGLYENFVKMDAAHIRTEIPITLQVPVKFDIQINQQVDVVLSQDTPINGARITLTTGGLNITNAPANVVLPAGTHLPIMLVLTVPVDKQVPVSLIVPIDIPLNQTDLHNPFVGLQDVIRPLYCLLDPKAVDLNGLSICPTP